MRIQKALEEVRISAFTEAELRAYDKFWDIISSEKTLLSGSYNDGVKDGIEQGEKQKAVEIAQNMLSLHLPTETIAAATGLTEVEIGGISV